MSKKYTVKNGISIEISEELHEYLKISERKIRYIEKDLKQNKYIIDNKEEKVTVIASREDSLERLMYTGKDYPQRTSDFRESLTQKIMLEEALEKLNEKEKYLIVQLFYFCRTERSLAKELGVSQYTVNRNMHKILKKLRVEIEG